MATILIADDLPENGHRLAKLFQEQGYQTLVAVDGATALAQALSGPPDLVVSGLPLAPISSFELCERMKGNPLLCKVPFILCTQSHDRQQEQQGLEAGADRVLSNPSGSELLVQVRELLAQGSAGRSERQQPTRVSALEYLHQRNEALFESLDRKDLDLQRLNDLYTLLHKINRTIRSSRSEGELLKAACDLCIEWGKFDLAWACLIPRPGEPLRADFLAGPLSGYARGLEVSLEPDIRQGMGPSARCLRENRIIICQDWLSDPSLEPWRSRAQAFGIRSSAGLPIITEDRAVAVLNLYSTLPGFFTQERLNLIEALAQDLSFAIRNLTRQRQKEEGEKALRAGEMEYRAAFDQGAVGMAQVSIEGRYLRVNRRFCEILGYSAEELIGFHYNHFTHPEDRAASSRLLKHQLIGHEENYDLRKRLHRKDGETIWVELSGGPVRGPDGRVLYLLNAYEDITQRMEDERKLLEEKAKLQTLIRTIPDLVWLKDLEGVYQFCNQRFEAFIGRPEHEINGRTDYDFVEKEIADGFRAHDHRALETEGPSLREEWVTFATDGHRELLETIKTPLRDASGSIVGVLGIARDVTQNRQDQDRLRKLSRAIEQSPVMVLITNLMGTIEHVNPRFTEITGYSPEEAIGSNPRMLKSGTTPAKVYEDLWKTILSGQGWHGEFQNRKKNGELYWESTAISPIVDEGGAITHFVALKEDITPLKIAQTELQTQLSELRRWHAATLGRESRILDLKREVNELLGRLDEEPRYDSVRERGTQPEGLEP